MQQSYKETNEKTTLSMDSFDQTRQNDRLSMASQRANQLLDFFPVKVMVSFGFLANATKKGIYTTDPLLIIYVLDDYRKPIQI